MTPATDQATIPKPSLNSDLGTIYRLADHLDATLAIGEDLLRQSIVVAPLTPGDESTAIAHRHREISEFARTVRALELAITARVLQARARAVEVQHTHAKFLPLIRLFVGGTAALADAVASQGSGYGDGLGDVTKAALTGGPQILAFLCNRGILPATEASLASIARLAVTEDYRLAEGVLLGTLMDMIAQFLESLDLAFDLYAEPRTQLA